MAKSTAAKILPKVKRLLGERLFDKAILSGLKQGIKTPVL